jgi:hypothetical protein
MKRAPLLCMTAVVATLGLGGCGGDPDPVLRQAFGYVCANESGVLCKTRPVGADGAAVSRYCYETIGEANCFDQPDVMSKNQELGSSGK